MADRPMNTKSKSPHSNMAPKEKPKPLRVYQVMVQGVRKCFVKARGPTQASEIAQSDTRYGDLVPDGCSIALLTDAEAEAARKLGRVMEE